MKDHMLKRIITQALGVYLEVLARISPSRAAEKGFLLFCRPFRLKLNKKQLRFFDSAGKFTLDHEGYVVQGYRWGRGEKKILFLHGWQSHTYRWKPYIEALPQDQYTVYSLDAPGHGLSTGDFLTVPLYSSLIEKFVFQHRDLHAIVGHSIGGFSLLHAFYRFPELPVDRVVLLAPPGDAGEFLTVFKDTLGLSDRTVNLIIKHFAERYNVTPDFFSSSRFGKRVSAKGLIIHDEHDVEAPYSHAVALNTVWEQSKLITTKGIGHNLKSREVVETVVEYIQEPVLQPSGS